MNREIWERNHTSICVSHENWIRLNRLKTVGESFDDVIKKLLEKVEKNG
jgi:predicted CopG family antitoxin